MSSASLDDRPKAVIVGINGSVGGFLAKKLSHTHRLVGIDLLPFCTKEYDVNISVIVDDITQPGAQSVTELSSADILIFAVSFPVIGMAFVSILEYLKPDCLVVDTLSAKIPLAKLIDRESLDIEVVGINPMFSGDLDPFQRPMAVVVYRNDGRLSQLFIVLMESWQLQVHVTDANSHDRLMSVMQGMGHAMLFVFGKTFVDIGLDPALVDAFAPPPFRLLLLLLARITQNHPDVYWDIQANNPYSNDCRLKFQAFLDEFNQLVGDGDSERFSQFFAGLSSEISANYSQYQKASKPVFEFIHQYSCIRKIG